MRRPKYLINLNDEERKILKKISHRYMEKQAIIQRANIILMADEGKQHQVIAKKLNIRNNTVSFWVERWATSEGVEAKEKLQDIPRPGAPGKFTPEQLCQIIATACEDPEDHGRPITHWTHKELAAVVIEKGIVDSISANYLGELLKKNDLKPHQNRYWLNAKADEKKDERINDICDLYADSNTEDTTEITISVDEMTGIQALERNAPDLPMRPGKPQAREFEYTRHGTQTLIAGLNVKTGEIQAECGDTRTEEDFARFIARLVEENPGFSTYHFVMDQLNTHKSESLVNYVAEACEAGLDLGIKGKKGILKSMESREQFLTQKNKKIVIHYTPKHASWMNQIEIWFGILARKVIKRGNFSSQIDLKTKIMNFIDYFNETLAKPFRWTYQGKALTI